MLLVLNKTDTCMYEFLIFYIHIKGKQWSVEEQTKLCQVVAEKIGFDFDKGRLDVSVHPFTGGSHPTDVRITTRYDLIDSDVFHIIFRHHIIKYTMCHLFFTF